MSIRIGVDLDGTLADLSTAYHQLEDTLFPEPGAAGECDESIEDAADQSDEPTDKERVKAAKEATRRRDVTWRALRQTENLWQTLDPIEPGAVRALYEASINNGWEVFFITQRPSSAGDTVQRQSQLWLMAHGFETPSVLTLVGSRGKAALALELDFLIDDTPKNCIDVISDSGCRPILVLRDPNPTAEAAAARMRIGVVRSVTDAIRMMAEPKAETRQGTVGKILKKLGFHA